MMKKFTIDMIKHYDQKSNLGRQGLFITVPCNSSSSKALRAGTQAGQAPDAGADVKAMEGAAYWLVS